MITPDIFSLAGIGTFLALGAIIVLLLLVMKLIDMSTNFMKNRDIVDTTFTLLKFFILGAPVFLLFYQVLNGQIPNILDYITLMFSGLFMWGIAKIIYDLFKEVL